MAGFEDIQGGLDRFNKKYGTSFRFENYELEVERRKSFKVFFESNVKGTPADNTYRDALTVNFRTAMEKMYRSEIKPFKLEDMINEFEDLMDDYRKHFEGKEKDLPGILGGLRGKKELYDVLERQILDLRRDKATTVQTRYLEGKCPLRQMRAELASVQQSELDGNTLTAEKLSNIMVYAEALKRTTESRSTWWKRFHFIRSAAEQRDLKALQDYIEEIQEANEDLYLEAEALAKQDVVSGIRNEIKAAKKAIRAQEKPAEKVQKENANVNEKDLESTVVKNAQSKANVEKKNTIVIANSEASEDRFYNRKLTQTVKGKISEIMGTPLYSKEQTKLAYIDTMVFPHMEKRISEMWRKFESAQPNDKETVIAGQSVELFFEMYSRMNEYGKDVKERIILTQKLCDLALKQYSPTSSDEKYAKFHENNIVNLLEPAEVARKTGYEGSVTMLLRDVKNELAKEPVIVADADEKQKIADAKPSDMIKEQVKDKEQVKLN